MNLNGKKVYKDINEVIEATIEVPKRYWEFEELMRDKPNFDKSPGARKIYQRLEEQSELGSGWKAESYLIRGEIIK